MVFFFQALSGKVYALDTNESFTDENKQKLQWLFGNAKQVEHEKIIGDFIGPRKEMITPWSTNAVEITRNMGIGGILRIEEFYPKKEGSSHDPMLQAIYSGLDQNLFFIDIKPEPIRSVEDIQAYNINEGLALNDEEVDYLKNVSVALERPLTDS